MEEKKDRRFRRIGYSIRQMNHDFKGRLFREGTAEGIDEITLMHAWILGYLRHNENKEIYQKTLEADLGMCRSSVTGLVQLLEKKAYIIRESVPSDARLKRICLTELGRSISLQVEDALERMESTMRGDISEEELEIFFEVSDKIRNHLKDDLSNKENRKEEKRC